MSRASLHLHVGFHKTGTTWLQRLVFPELKGVNYIGKRFSAKGAKNNFNHLYNDSYAGSANKGRDIMELIFIDIYKACLGGKGLLAKEYQADPVHLSKEVSEKVCEFLTKKIKRKLSKKITEEDVLKKYFIFNNKFQCYLRS
jgi:hypothetical protein